MKTIFAVDNKWGLGKKNDLLFSLKEDMRHFVAHTKGKTVVMGSNTLLSFPGGMPLKNRTNIVLNPNGTEEDAMQKGYILVKSLDELFATLKNYDSDQTYVIGGAMMYRTFSHTATLPTSPKSMRTAARKFSTKTLTICPIGNLSSKANPSTTTATLSAFAPTKT